MEAITQSVAKSGCSAQVFAQKHISEGSDSLDLSVILGSHGHGCTNFSVELKCAITI